MAEPTEAEQQKTNKSLESLDKKADDQQTSLQKLTSIIKEGNAYSVMAHEESMGQENDLIELEAMRESILRKHGKVQEKTLAALEKQTAEDEKKKAEDKGTDEKKEQGEKSRFERLGNWFDELKKNAEDKNFFDDQKFKYEGGFFTRQLKWMRVIKLQGDEKKKHDEYMKGLCTKMERFQRLSYNMAVRAAKLALRPAKAIKDWGVKGLKNMKDKAFDWIKSLGKLLVLLGIWGAALWLDANMLKEDWEALKEKLTAWKDKLIGWWDSLDGVLDDAIYWFNEIKDWFQNIFGENLGLWLMALTAFGTWMLGPKLAFMLTMGAAKGALWGMKKLLQKMGIIDLPDPKDVDKNAKGAKKATKAKASWWKRMFGITSDATDVKAFDKKWGVDSKKNAQKGVDFWQKVVKSGGVYRQGVEGLADTLDNTPEMKKGWFAKLGDKFKSVTKGIGDWMGNATKTVGGWMSKAKSGVGSFFKGVGDTLGKIPGAKLGGKILGGGAKLVAKLATPFEAIRGAWAGFAETGEDDKRNLNEKMDDASRGMVKGVTDFLVGDLLELGGDLEGLIRDKEGKDTFLGGAAESFKTWSDGVFGTWKEGTKMFEGGGVTGLRLEAPEAVRKKQAAAAQRRDLLARTKAFGLTEEVTKGTGRGNLTKVKDLAFDKEGFKRLLLGASKDESFAMLSNMVVGLAKAGKITAEDAERYKMDISKEQAAGTPPIIINNSPTTNNSGSTSMIAASSANDPMKEVLKDW